VNALIPYLSWWRTIRTRDREIVEALVDLAHHGPSPELQAALDAWDGLHYWSRIEGVDRLVLIRSLQPPQRERWWLHGILFAATFLTVWMSGALLTGSSLPLAFPFSVDYARAPEFVSELLAELLRLPGSLGFAMALMAILLAHESGHYIRARRYGLNASPPYFLPAPPIVNFIGTFGAFIRLRSQVLDRRQLMDVGAAGPWAGFIVAVVALGVGLLRSQVVPEVGPSHQFVLLAESQIYLGDSPIFIAFREFLVGEGTVLLHPLAFAGWIGIFVTTLNLLPLGQLDGGHVLYALLGRRQGVVSAVAFVGLFVLGYVVGREVSPWIAWFWWTWAGLILIVGRGRLVQPTVLDPHRPLPTSRKLLGVATLALFLATFSPVPIFPMW
jgi:Zn-dependent protease